MTTDKKLHVVMFPWLAFGHMIPYLQLSKLIVQKGHRVSFVSTAGNIRRLPKIHPDIVPLLNFIELPLPSVENLPQNAEATSDVPYDIVQYLKKAYDLLKQPLANFLQSSDVDWIFYDFAPYWVPQEIGPKLGIKTALLSVFPPECMAFLGPLSGDHRKIPEDFTVTPYWVPFSTTAAFRYFEVVKIFDSVSGNITGVSDLERLKLCAHHGDAVVVRGSPEFNPEWIQVLGDIYGKPILPVGQLPTTEYDTEEDNTPAWRSIKEWLDKQARGSVVYVAFGSEAKPTQSELDELAYGLEQSGLPFFWVLRTRRGADDPDPIRLPEGFEERTEGRGVVCTTWAPQLKILAHGAVGGFLTHSGWSSVVEAVQWEIGLILVTFLADQGINARVLEEKKMGYSVPRDERDGWFSRDSVAESLQLVMVKEEGKIYRDRIKEMKDLFVNKDKEERLIDQFLDHLKAHTKRR